MMRPARVIERLVLAAPLAVRFWDPVGQGVAADGLEVSAYLPSRPAERAVGLANPTGVFVFHRLPFLSEEALSGVSAGAALTLEVIDRAGRFLPFRLAVDLPADLPLRWDCPAAAGGEGSLPTGAEPPPDAIPLFSAPGRSAPGGLAAIRVMLRDAAGGGPAAWAALEARDEAGGLLGYTLADGQGQAVIFAPYPLLDLYSGGASGSGPPPNTLVSPFQQSWPVSLRVFYAPASPAPDLPELCSTLSQPPAYLWDSLSPALPLSAVRLYYGQPLVVRSAGQSHLWVSTGAQLP